MAVHSRWLIPHRVIYTEFTGILTIEELRQENELILKLMDSSHSPVHHISDTTQLQRFPLNFRIIADTLSYYHHPRMAWELGVGMMPKVQEISLRVAQLHKVQIAFANSTEEALRHIRMMDKTLADRLTTQLLPSYFGA